MNNDEFIEKYKLKFNDFKISIINKSKTICVYYLTDWSSYSDERYVKFPDQNIQIACIINSKGIAIILVTHENDTANHAKRIIRIKDGQIVSDEPVLKRKFADGGSELVK